MQNTINNTTWDDIEIVEFALLKKRIKKCVHIILSTCITIVGLLLFYIVIKNNKQLRYNLTRYQHRISAKTEHMLAKIYSNKLSTISIEGNKLIKLNDLYAILGQIQLKSINSHSMQQVTHLIKVIPVVKDVIVTRNITTPNLLKITIVEHNIVAMNVANDNECLISAEGYSICNDQLAKYELKDILLTQNLNSTKDIVTINDALKKHNLFNEIKRLNFTQSGRFDIYLKNSLLLKMPRYNWENAIHQFAELNTKYKLTRNDIDIKYIDFRIDGKLYVGS